MVLINSPAVSRPELPLGGVKQSRLGRERGEPGLQEFLNRKLAVAAP